MAVPVCQENYIHVHQEIRNPLPFPSGKALIFFPYFPYARPHRAPETATLEHKECVAKNERSTSQGTLIEFFAGLRCNTYTGFPRNDGNVQFAHSRISADSSKGQSG